jgi:hypothetical protein
MGMAALIIGILALVVAVMVPTIFLVWGKPKFRVLYQKQSGYAISCSVQAITPSRFLLFIGVDRRIMDIDCTTTITNMDGRIIEFYPFATTSSDNMRIPVAGIMSKYDGHVFLKDQVGGYGRLLNVGFYTFELEIWDAKYKTLKRKERRRFRVNDCDPFVEWVN